MVLPSRKIYVKSIAYSLFLSNYAEYEALPSFVLKPVAGIPAIISKYSCFFSAEQLKLTCYIYEEIVLCGVLHHRQERVNECVLYAEKDGPGMP